METDFNALLNSSDREVRIAARRQRIAARLAAKREGEGDGGKKAAQEEKKELGKGKQQILESRKRLAKIRSAGDEQVTSIRVVSDDRENRRRIEEETRRQELRGKLLAEAEHSARRNATVAMRWADLFSVEVPQELYEEIEKQRTACDKITASKERLIAEIKYELKSKDDGYVKALKRQAEDIDSLLQHMGNQFRELQAAYLEELEEIEQSFLQERRELLDANKAEMNSLFEKRSSMEQQFVEAMQERAEEYQEQLEALRVQDAEDYNILKIRLETDIQNLEQHLEAMRATYQLNTEKLEYNYRVLEERDHENQSTINQQKRKIARQRDILSSLKSKYAESDKKFQEENMKLTDEYRRITEQFKDLQAKYRHFEVADIRRYKEVWDMNEALVAELVKKLLLGDKIIHEQQLGLNWNPPSDEVFASPQTQIQQEPTKEEEIEAEGETKEEQVQEKIQDPRFKGMLEMLCDEAGFLVDMKVQKLVDSVPKEEGNQLRVDSILKALGVSDGATFDSLAQALAKDGSIPTEMVGMALVVPSDAVARLKAFVEQEQRALSSQGGKALRLASATQRLELHRRAEKDKEYWERISHVISDKMYRIWKALEGSLNKYQLLLNDRAGQLSSVANLQRQNDELRSLLNQYLSSKINDDLVIPPTKVI
mmetsp:Transcript_7426/g.8564  ORF Transcript_7426/g.8564 Transcript_7426/m.8564 type:complete len:657 (+) Transcript_7426:326-2296(+)|eukprot:CAMPEP_0197845666 /NCGR_PEP_ID=MMETSP1438-20131217/2564_1 /TAXON_ID=1461541 /ORGANISM="Pterosperma sp., Strain CCMP1384" /LENGTH=656 /DNA_ID=CAMNT_0043457053 /DNA_START=315 /DNA_END=2285 /DNA_ORIENTATION=+